MTETFRISRLIAETTGVLVFKAPTGFQYSIEDIHASVPFAGDNAVVILDYAIEEELGTIPLTPSPDFVAFITSDIALGGIDINFMTPQKAKWISIGPIGATSFTMAIVISGKLIKISRRDAILEWFRKGR